MKQLPNAPRVEASVLGAVFLDAEQMPLLRQRITTSDVFYQPLHRAVWLTMVELDDAGKSLDVMTVLDTMQRSGKLETFDANDVAALSGACVSVQTMPAQTTILVENYQRRRLHHVMSLASDHVLTAEPEKAIDWQQGEIDGLRTGTVDDVEERATAAHILTDCFSMWERQQSGERTALSTGVKPFDVLTDGGLVPGFNYVIGALSGHGKTTFASALAMRFLQEHPDAIVHWYSSEVPETYQLMRLMAQAHIMVGGQPINIAERDILDPFSSRTDHQKLFGAISKLSAEVRQYNLQIYRQGTIDVRAVRNRVRATRTRFPDKPLLVVVDYIQNATAGRTESRGVDIGVASNVIREIAVDQNAICLTLTQFTESANSTPIPMPNIRNSRWAKDIENDATEYIVYHRPWLDNRVILQQAKSRYGSLGHVRVEAGRAGYELGGFPVDAISLHTRDRVIS